MSYPTLDKRHPTKPSDAARGLSAPPAPADDATSLHEAEAFCRRLARSHYENFTVVSFLLPCRLRQHFYNVYAYCRWADDLADESESPAASLVRLDAWEAELDDCYRGRPRHPIFVALTPTIAQFEIPRGPFADLLQAFRQDQVVTRYETHDDVLAYCQNSANPVGRLVLYLARAHNQRTVALSDSICTGLQLANFCQDVWRDWQRGRIYLPQTELRATGYTEAMLAGREFNTAFQKVLADEVSRARGYLEAGRPLVELVPRELQLDIRLFIEGGLATLRAIERTDYNVLARRPTLSKAQKGKLALWAWLGLQRERFRRTPDIARTETPRTRNVARTKTPLPFGERAGEGGPAAWQPPSPRRSPTRLSSSRAGARGSLDSSLADSYAHCRLLARRSASSFYYSFLLLPRPKRKAMYALYAFLRHTDDIADGPESLEVRRRRLAAWRRELRRALAGANDDRLLPALADAAERFSIPAEYLEAVIDGVEMDLAQCRYRTADELEQYCYRVASCVGFCCLHIWGFSDPQALEAGHKCGLALQWTNILRDVKQDSVAGRIYLPLEDLERFGYTEDDLMASVYDDRFRQLMRYEIARVESYYREAVEVRRWLSPEGRRAFSTVLATYRGLLDEIKRRDGDVLEGRIQLGRWRKARIALGCVVGVRRPAKTAQAVAAPS